MPFDAIGDIEVHPAILLSEEERKTAVIELRIMSDFWHKHGSAGWFQGSMPVGIGRKNGTHNRYSRNWGYDSHCLISFYWKYRDQPIGNSTGFVVENMGATMPASFKAMGFESSISAILWNNDSETTFEMVLNRVDSALSVLEAMKHNYGEAAI